MKKPAPAAGRIANEQEMQGMALAAKLQLRMQTKFKDLTLCCIYINLKCAIKTVSNLLIQHFFQAIEACCSKPSQCKSQFMLKHEQVGTLKIIVCALSDKLLACPNHLAYTFVVHELQEDCCCLLNK
jgi:hypothetical protein